MKVTVYLKKCSPDTSNICFRVREKNVDIKVVSPLEVQDKYWDTDSLCYRRTTAVPAAEQKRLPEQIAAIIERAEDLLGQGGQPVDETGHRGCAVPSPGIRAGPLEPSRPCPRVFGEVRRCGEDEGAYRPFRAQDDPLPRLPPEDTGRGGLHPLRGNRHAGADERFPGLCGERTWTPPPRAAACWGAGG